MKTNKFVFELLMILFFSIFAVSCGKEVMSGSNAKSYDYNQSLLSAGAIVDLGAVDGEVRKMNVSLTEVSLSKPEMSVGYQMESSLFKLDILTPSDGVIKEGIYEFSEANSLAPFTFTTASVYIPNSSSGYFDSFDLVSGTVAVDRVGTTYEFTIDGVLSNGNPIQGNFSGILSYADLP